MLYVSKAMDLFDLSLSELQNLNLVPTASDPTPPSKKQLHLTPPAPHLPDISAGLAPLANIPVLILGVQSDILFPVEQQQETAAALRSAGNTQVVYYELGGVWGHDTFL